MDIANLIDASDYMGLELHLSKRIERECEQHRQNYIRAVIDEQMRCLSTDDLADFARLESKNSVARSHEIGEFYANRPFDELSLELSLVPSRKHHLNLALLGNNRSEIASRDGQYLGQFDTEKPDCSETCKVVCMSSSRNDHSVITNKSIEIAD
jgi:hypothetical protein